MLADTPSTDSSISPILRSGAWARTGTAPASKTRPQKEMERRTRRLKVDTGNPYEGRPGG